MSELVLTLNSLQDTQRLATQLCAAAELPLVVALSGTLGAGKTQFVRFAAQSLGIAAEEVTSPTYVLLQRYSGRKVIYHFDFYRLNSVAEVWDLGIDELLEQPALIFIEWAEKFPECLPVDHLSLNLEPLSSASESSRRAVVSATGPNSNSLIKKLESLAPLPYCV